MLIVGRARSRSAGWREHRSPPQRDKVSLHTPVAEALAGVLPPISCAETPCVYRGLCASWPSLAWDANKLKAALPEVRATISVSGSFPRDVATDSQCPVQLMKMQSLLSSIANCRADKRHYYCHGNVLPEQLACDCPLPSTLLANNKAAVARRSLWISGDGACSPLHYDLPSVLLCQIRGRKRVHLYSPAHHDQLKPRGATFPALTAQERIATTRRCHLDARDHAGLCVELRAGDALLIPSGWWHEVESVADDGGEESRKDEISHDGLNGCVISVGINWPEIADAVSAFAPWRSWTSYPLLSKGQVIAQYYGEEQARAILSAEAYAQSVFDAD